jgi:hypothetical protein
MKLTALLPYFLLLAAACGKSDAENFADSYCAEVAKCCTQAGLSSNGQMCHMLFSGGSYNATAGQACLNDMKAKVAAGTFCSDNETSTACNQVYSTGASGNKKPGDTCEQNSDCASSAKGKVTCASLYTGSANWISQMPGANSRQGRRRALLGDSGRRYIFLFWHWHQHRPAVRGLCVQHRRRRPMRNRDMCCSKRSRAVLRLFQQLCARRLL